MDIYTVLLSAFDEDTVASTSQDSSFGDENSQTEQDPLAIEAKVNFLLFINDYKD